MDEIEIDDIQLLVQLGVAPDFIELLLDQESLPVAVPCQALPLTAHDKLTPTEVGILRAGGASVEDAPEGDNGYAGKLLLRDLIEECRVMVSQCHDLAMVAAILGTSEDEAETLTREVNPSLYSIQLGDEPLLFPSWQFTGSRTIPNLKPLLLVDGLAANPLVFSRFMLSRNADLATRDGALCPRDWLVEDLPLAPVMRLAQDLVVG
tara:strand:+ start:512 stop:1132 length:621 start_codon:yes stop_codon:yes gene_type:complete